MQLFTAILEQINVEQSPVRYQAFAIFNNLMPLIAGDDWEILFDLFNSAIQVSKSVEEYQFTMLPNPSVVARILDRFDTTGSPWTSMDKQKDFIISTLNEILRQLEKQSNVTMVEDQPSDPLLANTVPDVDPFVPHYSSCDMNGFEVLDPSKALAFASDDLIPSTTETAVYEVPPKPIEIAAPSLDIPSSPMVLRKQTALFSPRSNHGTVSKKKRFIHK